MRAGVERRRRRAARVASAATHGLIRRLRPWLASASPVSVPASAGAIEVVDARHRRPVVDLVLPADAPAEVHTPDAIGAALEAQRLERNADLGRPAARVAPGRDRPHRVPAGVDVAPFVGNLRVGLRAGGVGHEDEAVAAIGEGVEDHLEGVLLAGDEILADVVDDHAGGIGVVADDADVERVAIEGEAHLGQLGGGLPFVRLGLDESGRAAAVAPDLFVEGAVEHDRRQRTATAPTVRRPSGDCIGIDAAQEADRVRSRGRLRRAWSAAAPKEKAPANGRGCNQGDENESLYE